MQAASKRKADEEAGAKIKADEEAKNKTDEEAQAKRQQHRRLAESGLKRAMSMAEVELLVPAINWAVQQGADSELLAQARTQKTSLEEAKYEQETAAAVKAAEFAMQERAKKRKIMTEGGKPTGGKGGEGQGDGGKGRRKGGKGQGAPTPAHTAAPTAAPTASPTAAPTAGPTAAPTAASTSGAERS